MSITEKGFSLPEITIALGLLAGISLVTIKILENQANNEANLKAQAEIQKTMAILKAALNNPESCRGMLAGQAISPTLNGETKIGLPPALPSPAINPARPGLYQNIKNRGYREILSVDSVKGTNYGVFRIAPASYNPIKLIRVSNSGTNLDAVDLSIQFNVETKSIIFRDDENYDNDRTYIHKIPLLVTYNKSTNRLVDCGIMVSDGALAAKQKLCESMGNMTKWNGTECEFIESKCTGSQIPNRQKRTNGNDDVFTCVDIHDQFNVMHLFDTIDGTVTKRCQSTTGTYRVVAKPDADDNNRIKLTLECI